MSKEWILNSVTSRFQLNYKRNVGPTSDSIRKCCPSSSEEWEDYYFKNVRDKKHIIELGKKLYVKITEVIPKELETITEEDCIHYIYNLVICRTYDGYTTEIKTIYEQLEKELKFKIKPAQDEWDRRYNVDFFIEVKGRYIGLQIKPVFKTNHIPQIYKEQQIQKGTHEKFTKKYGGKVFYIYSAKEGERKEIVNKEVIEDIKKEMIELGYTGF